MQLRYAWLLLLPLACTHTAAAPLSTVVQPGAAPAPPADASYSPSRESCDLDACADVPSSDEPKEPRAWVSRPKARQLLVIELMSMENLLAATPTDSTDRPNLLRKLAEGYSELGASADIDGQPKIAEGARKGAIRHYDTLRRGYTGFCVNPGQSPESRRCVDEVAYFMALEHERLGDHVAACSGYSAVVATDDSAYRVRACDAMRQIATGF